MSAYLARAQLLLQQSRPADAERELMMALAETPQHPLPHALLALCLQEQGKASEALKSAQTAVGLAPDSAYFHYIHALILHRLDREPEALKAVVEAIRLDPDDEDGFALLASIRLAQRDWPAALEAAQQGLALNPEHIGSANLRAMALVRLGRKDEAAQTIDYALERAPENSFSHANQGWNRLHQNEPAKAQEHFREALRLEPDLEYARNGMLEAIKARNPVYRGMLAYFLWIGRQSGQLQWVFIIGSYFMSRTVVVLAKQHPLLWVPAVLFYLFIYLSWTAVPMFNLLLRLHPFGRFVLSRDERKGSYWFGGTILAAIIALGYALTVGSESVFALFIVLLVLSICVAATVVKTGRNRLILGSAAACIALLGIAACFGETIGMQDDEGRNFLWFAYSFIGFQLLANFLPRK